MTEECCIVSLGRVIYGNCLPLHASTAIIDGNLDTLFKCPPVFDSVVIVYRQVFAQHPELNSVFTTGVI